MTPYCTDTYLARDQIYFICPLLSDAICHAQLVAAENRVASSLV